MDAHNFVGKELNIDVQSHTYLNISAIWFDKYLFFNQRFNVQLQFNSQKILFLICFWYQIV